MGFIDQHLKPIMPTLSGSQDCLLKTIVLLRDNTLQNVKTHIWGLKGNDKDSWSHKIVTRSGLKEA